MNKLKYLIEQATRKTEMRWRVFAYDPEKDNALVGTPKTYDCICGASAAKMEILKDHPNYVVEIIAESIQKNEGRPQIGDTVKYTSHARQTSGSGKIVKVYRDYGNNLWVDLDVKDRYGKPISLLANRMKQTNYHSFEYFGESKQKNEAKYKLKGVYYSADGQDKFRVDKIVGNKYEVTYNDGTKATLDEKDITKWITGEAANIDVKHPGILEVPDGKNVEDLPQSHFEKLVDKKGYAPVIRALTNLEVWNKDKNKKLSAWASNMADKLKKKYRPESRSIDKDSVIAKNGKYYHKVHGYEVELRDGKFHRANTVDNANTRALNKKIDDLSKSKTINDNSLADEKELRNLVNLKVKLNTLKDAYEKETDIMSKSKLRVAIKQLEDNIATQEEVVSSSHNVNKDKLTTKQIPNLLNTKK